MQSLGEDRTTRADCSSKICLYFFVCHVPKPGRSSCEGDLVSNYCVTVYGSILMQFSPFSEVIALSDGQDSLHFRC